MARLLLLSDSNFCNNLGDFRGAKISELQVKSCQSRRAAMTELSTFEERILVIACLDMIAADVAKNSSANADEAVEMYYSQLLYKVIEKIDEADGKMAVGIVAPIFWSSHSEPVKRGMNHAYRLMMRTPPTNVWFSDFMREVNTGADGVHLTKRSADCYIQNVFNLFRKINEESKMDLVRFDLTSESATVAAVAASSWANDQPLVPDPDAVVALNPPVMVSPARTSSMVSLSMLSAGFSRQEAPYGPRRLATGERLMQMAHGPTPRLNFSVPPPGFAEPRTEVDHWRTPDVNSSLARIERRLGLLEAKVSYNNVMTASLKEDQDTEANRATLNKVTISAVPMDSLSSLTEIEKIEAIKKKAKEMIDIVKQEGKEYVAVFVKHLNPNVRGQQKAVLEVKFESAKMAADFRSDFVKKLKDKDPNLPAKMNVAPVVRLSTRVRVEILHSVVNLMLRNDPTIVRAMCLQYIPKPVIKIVRKAQGGNEYARTMTFIEAVCWVKENDLDNYINLNKAYDRAGSAFRGILTQTFVLMTSTSSR